MPPRAYARGGQVQGGDTGPTEPTTVPTGRERGDAPPVHFDIGPIYGVFKTASKADQACGASGTLPCAI